MGILWLDRLARQGSPGEWNWHNRGWRYAELGNIPAAKSDFQEFLRLTEGDPDLSESRNEVQGWLGAN